MLVALALWMLPIVASRATRPAFNIFAPKRTATSMPVKQVCAISDSQFRPVSLALLTNSVFAVDLQLKETLLSKCESVNRGLAETPEDREAITALISQLEAKNPTKK